jgi:hypothetical protein
MTPVLVVLDRLLVGLPDAAAPAPLLLLPPIVPIWLAVVPWLSAFSVFGPGVPGALRIAGERVEPSCVPLTDDKDEPPFEEPRDDSPPAAPLAALPPELPLPPDAPPLEPPPLDPPPPPPPPPPLWAKASVDVSAKAQAVMIAIRVMAISIGTIKSQMERLFPFLAMTRFDGSLAF